MRTGCSPGVGLGVRAHKDDRSNKLKVITYPSQELISETASSLSTTRANGGNVGARNGESNRPVAQDSTMHVYLPLAVTFIMAVDLQARGLATLSQQHPWSLGPKQDAAIRREPITVCQCSMQVYVMLHKGMPPLLACKA